MRAAVVALRVALLVVLAVGPARAVSVRVQGSARLEASVAASPAGATVRGRLLDDAGQPIFGAGTEVRIRFKIGSATVRLEPPQGCDVTRSGHVTHQRGSADATDVYRVAVNDRSGTFCVRTPVAWDPSAGGVAELEYEGSAYHSAARTAVDFNLEQRSLRLSFAPSVEQLALDRPSQLVRVQTELDPAPAAGELTDTVQLELLLEEGGNIRSLTTAAVRPGDSTQLELGSERFGAPGPARLIVRYAGSPAIHAAEHSAVVQKTLRVTLSIAGPTEPGDPSDGIGIRVAVGSARGAVESGSVEARLGAESVGTAPVRAGAVRLMAVFESAHAGEVPLTLHYLPAAPWWHASEPLRILVPVRAPSSWRRLPWLLGALVVAAWVLRSWLRPPRTEKAPLAATSVPSGRAAVDLLERGADRSGWRGQVVDAHDGVAIAGARVSVLRPAFGGDGVVRSATTDADGNFEIEPLEHAVEGARFQTQARWHATLTGDLPPAGQIVISLISRRRALIERLVQWADLRGRPWKPLGEATPGHVARIAHGRKAEDVAAWASAVEHAAYGPIPPDEHSEARVRAQEPEWGKTKAQARRQLERKPR